MTEKSIAIVPPTYYVHVRRISQGFYPKFKVFDTLLKVPLHLGLATLTVVNGSRAVGGSSCGWKEQLGQTNLYRSLHLWVILP